LIQQNRVVVSISSIVQTMYKSEHEVETRASKIVQSVMQTLCGRKAESWRPIESYVRVGRGTYCMLPEERF
jgi:hypothetical protein